MVVAKRGTALAAARSLRVKGRAPKTGYRRSKFGTPWKDTNRNGCNQREDVLNRDLTRESFSGCNVLKGVLHDPYTGKTISYKRGVKTSAKVQIDHMVAESNAWQTGAGRWTSAKRLKFANDTLGLMATNGPTNAAKGDGDTATWLPPRKAYRCTYVAYQVAVKKLYGLWVTKAEKAAMGRVLVKCPNMKLPKRKPIPARPKPKVKVVHPGAFCSPVGAKGRTSKGTPMKCSRKAGDPRARWRKA